MAASDCSSEATRALRSRANSASGPPAWWPSLWLLWLLLLLLAEAAAAAAAQSRATFAPDSTTFLTRVTAWAWALERSRRLTTRLPRAATVSTFSAAASSSEPSSPPACDAVRSRDTRTPAGTGAPRPSSQNNCEAMTTRLVAVPVPPAPSPLIGRPRSQARGTVTKRRSSLAGPLVEPEAEVSVEGGSARSSHPTSSPPPPPPPPPPPTEPLDTKREPSAPPLLLLVPPLLLLFALFEAAACISPAPGTGAGQAARRASCSTSELGGGTASAAEHAVSTRRQSGMTGPCSSRPSLSLTAKAEAAERGVGRRPERT